MIRKDETTFLMSAVRAAECASIIGLSNTGKSTLLRDLCVPSIREAHLGDNDDDRLFVYVDCNQMPERSEQALHEVILRSALEALRRAGTQDAILKRLERLYEQVIQPPTPIRSPLAFNDAINVICAESERALIILFDEFDDPFGRLDGRTFLNLRAMKDRLARDLVYVTATDQPLMDIRTDHEAAEFIELFAARERWIGLMNRDDSLEMAREFAADNGAHWGADEFAFVVDQAGGHFGLLEVVLETYMRVAGGVPDNARSQAVSVAQLMLSDDAAVRRECARLWAQLSEPEQQYLMSYRQGESAHHEARPSLIAKRLLENDADDVQDQPVVGDVWNAFIKRQSVTHPGAERGVRVDVDSGEVYVDGALIEQLTDLEYKLALLLYGRLNKIVDKYAIVTQVWGENYLDEVDDARIEKLVSRLRAKLEPAAAEPRYLITVRGRGYKLVG